MAKILIRTVNGGNELRYMRGDPVVVVPDDHVWGRYESLEQWISEGRMAADWPDEFVILELTGLDVSAARQYLAEVQLMGAAQPVMARRRRYMADIDALYALLSAAKKAQYAAARRVALSWGNSAVRAAFKVRG